MQHQFLHTTPLTPITPVTTDTPCNRALSFEKHHLYSVHEKYSTLLSTDNQHTLYTQALRAYAIQGSVEMVSVLLFDPIFNLQHHRATLFGALSDAIEADSRLVFNYVLQAAPLQIKTDQPDAFLDLLVHLFYYASGATAEQSLVYVKALWGMIEEALRQQPHQSAQKSHYAYNAFKEAWLNRKTEHLLYFIDHFFITGQESQVQDFLNARRRDKFTGHKDVMMRLVCQQAKQPLVMF